MSTEVVIEKDVPLPERTGQGRTMIYPALYSMAIGESFAVPKERGETLTNAAAWCRRKTGKQFLTKTMGDTVRVWRIQPKEQ